MSLGFSNPYLGQQADAITQQVTNNLQRNILPGINSDAISAGGFGGSRQGVAQANAIGQTNQGLSNSLASLYGTNYQQDVGNAINAAGVYGNLGLGNQQQLLNFYTQQRGLDQSGAQLGANLFNQGNAGYLSQGQGVYGLGQTQQQAPWNVQQNAGNIFSQYSGLGGGQTQTLQGNAVGGALGGGLAGAQFGKVIGNNLGIGAGTNPYTSLQGNGVPDNAYDYYYGGGG